MCLDVPTIRNSPLGLSAKPRALRLRGARFAFRGLTRGGLFGEFLFGGLGDGFTAGPRMRVRRF